MTPQERDREYIKKGVVKSLQQRSKTQLGRWKASPVGSTIKFIRAVITSAKREVDGINRYSWQEIAWDDVKKRFAEKENGRSGDSESSTGWAMEAKWNSPYVVQGHEVELIKHDDYYYFFYRPEIVTGYLEVNNEITAAESIGSSGGTNKLLGSGDIKIWINNPDRGTAPVPPLTDNKFSGSSQTLKVFNKMPASIPGNLETATRNLIIYCGWESGRWLVLSAECQNQAESS